MHRPPQHAKIEVVAFTQLSPEIYIACSAQRGIVMTVQSQSGITCACGRYMYKNGTALIVEAAKDPNGASVIIAQLEALRTSKNRKKRQRYEDLNERFRILAAYGELEIPGEMRPIRDELWEIKTASDRVPFYRGPASKTHKQFARLAFWFEKAKGKTQQGKMPQKLINKGLWIVKADAAHDAI